MIEQPAAMSILVEACPSFVQGWSAHIKEHGNGLPYVAAGAFARHLLKLHQANDVSSFPAVAAAIERLHVEGSSWVKEFATIGVLESIQNQWANNNANPEYFRQFLGPQTERWWAGLNRFWCGKVSYVKAEG